MKQKSGFLLDWKSRPVDPDQVGGADPWITVDPDSSMGPCSVGALDLTWTCCPGHRTRAQEKHFIDEACSMIRSTRLCQPHPLLNILPLNPSLKLHSSLSFPSSPSPQPPPCVSAYGNATRCLVSKTGIMFLEDVWVILLLYLPG